MVQEQTLMKLSYYLELCYESYDYFIHFVIFATVPWSMGDVKIYG